MSPFSHHHFFFVSRQSQKFTTEPRDPLDSIRYSNPIIEKEERQVSLCGELESGRRDAGRDE